MWEIWWTLASSRVPLGLSSVPESAERDGGKPVAEGERLRSRVQQHAPLEAFAEPVAQIRRAWRS